MISSLLKTTHGVSVSDAVSKPATVNPWMFVSGGLLLMLLIVLVIVCVKRKQSRKRRWKGEEETGKGSEDFSKDQYPETTPNSYEKMTTREQISRARAISNVDRFGYSIVDEQEDNQGESGYVEIIDEPENGDKSTENLRLDSKVHVKSLDVSNNPTKYRLPDELRPVQHVTKHISCQDVCNEYDNSYFSTDSIGKDLESDLSRFNKYYTSMQLQRDVKVDEESRRGTLPNNFRVNEKDSTHNDSKDKTSGKRKQGDYDVPPPKLRTVAPSPGKTVTETKKCDDMIDTSERESKVRFSEEKALIHQISVYESSSNEDITET